MKNHIQMNKIEFMIGDLYDRDSVKDRNDFYLTEDRSLLYQSTTNGDYSILLGGNWRFELIVDSSTGLCIKFQSFLDELKVLHKPLVLLKVARCFFLEKVAIIIRFQIKCIGMKERTSYASAILNRLGK